MQEGAVKTIDRVAAIMTALSACDAGGLQLGDVAGAAGLPKPTAHRLLGALAHNGLAFQDLTTRRYRLGARAAALGGTARRQHVAATAQLALDRIAAATGDTAFASVREGAAAVCVARAIGSYPIRTLTLEIGARRPLGVGAGSLALLATLPDAEVARVLAHNAVWLQDYPRFTPPELWGLVERTRSDGYAMNEGRIVAAMNAIGIAVTAADGQPVVALSVAAIWDRMSGERCAELLRILLEETRRLRQTGDLGGAA